MIFQSIGEFRQSAFAPKVCIIGTGPAGMAIALQLAHAKIPVVMLEAGADEITNESQEFYKGEVRGDHYFDLDVTRIRLLGGCSNHWAGWCRVMDAHDFEQRTWIPDSGWPIKRADIEPFLELTHGFFDLVPFRPNISISEDIDWVQLIKSPAVHVGEKYRTDLKANSRIRMKNRTMVTDLVGEAAKVTSANLWSKDVLYLGAA